MSTPRPSSGNPYDDVPYEDYAIPQTHPDRLYVAGRAQGVATCAPDRCRYLELGCAHAVNLIALAARLPSSSFVGVELSAVHARAGQLAAQELGLSNLDVRQADVMDIDASLGEVDYIVAHGLYSWVPESVRRRILEVCRDRLADGGVAYISYNTMPAWGIRGGVRRAMVELSRGSQSEKERLTKAREALRLLRSVNVAGDTAPAVLLRQEIDELEERSDAYLLHDYLVPSNRAFSFREFADAASQSGLEYLCDLADSADDQSLENRVLDQLLDETGDRLVAEQLADVALYRQFRASVLCRADARRDDIGTPYDLVRSGYVAGSFKRVKQASSGTGRVVFDTLSGEPIAVEDRTLREVLVRLDRVWPSSLGYEELVDEVRGALASSERSMERSALAENLDKPLWRLHRQRQLLLGPRPLAASACPSKRPAASALTRFELTRGPVVTNVHHRAVKLEPFDCALLALLDGSRDRDVLTRHVVRKIEDGEIVVVGLEAEGGARGKPPHMQLLRLLQPVIDTRLEELCSLGLLEA